MTPHVSRFTDRRRGADMTNALLWAAFALVLFLSFIYAYQMVDMRRSKLQTTGLISELSTHARAMRAGQSDYEWLSAETLVRMGNVSNVNFTEVNGEFLVLIPHGGTVQFGPSPDSTQDFLVEIEWPHSGRTPRALCESLVSVIGDYVPSGALGVDYEVRAGDCEAPSPRIEVIYLR